MRKIIISAVMLLACVCGASAQQVGQYRPLPDSLYQNNKEYVEGNKYQKDAILFVDMLADTHPYYIKKERRQELMEKRAQLLRKCASCQDDSIFTTLLFDVLGKLHDKHTDLIDANRFMKMSTQKAKKQASQKEEAKSNALMACHGTLFDYTLLADKGICYLQFNQCADARTMRRESLPRFDETIDRMFEQMDSAAITTLVVDAQYNGGGSSMLCDELLIHLKPLSELKMFSTSIRFSDLMASFNPRVGVAKKSWEEAGHIDELYPMPAGKPGADFQQPKVFTGKVVFVQSPKTYSSAGILMTLARDNKIGTIIGTTSTFPPSHYGEILPYSLPNTKVLGSVCTKFFARPDASCIDDEALVPDMELNLDDKEAAWQFIVDHFGKK